MRLADNITGLENANSKFLQVIALNEAALSENEAEIFELSQKMENFDEQSSRLKSSQSTISDIQRELEASQASVASLKVFGFTFYFFLKVHIIYFIIIHIVLYRIFFDVFLIYCTMLNNRRYL